MWQSNKVDRLIYLLSPHVLNPGTHPEGQVPAGVLPKASSDRSFGTSYSVNERKGNNRALCSGHAVSDVAVLTLPVPTQIVDRRLYRMDQAWFVTQTNGFHDDRSQCSISGRYTFPFSFILLLSVCCWQTSLGSCYFYFYFAVCLSPIFLQSFKLSLFSVMARPGVNSEQNVVLIKQDRSVGRISGFRSL